MVATRLDRDDTPTRGFVLDGFPRTVAQADGFDDMLKPAEIDLVLDLVVPTELVPARLVGRQVCEDCGAIYSMAVPPKINWTCDVCGGEVYQREDDTEEAIKKPPRALRLPDRSARGPLREAGQARRGVRGGQPGRGEQGPNLGDRRISARRGLLPAGTVTGAVVRRTPDEIAKMRRAGKVVAEVISETRLAIKPGVTTRDLDLIAREVLERRGARSNFLNYHGFPR